MTQYTGHKQTNLTADDFRKKSNQELNTLLKDLRATLSALQGNFIEPPGYKHEPFKLTKGRPHPRFIRIEIARILTILNERGAEVTA